MIGCLIITGDGKEFTEMLERAYKEMSYHLTGQQDFKTFPLKHQRMRNMVRNKMQPLVQNIIWLFPSMLVLGAILPVSVTAEESYPALDPPFYQSGIVLDQHTVEETRSSKAATQEWTYHKTADGSHPSGHEQQAVWLMNRARYNPTQEGIWLASSTDPEVAGGRDFFGVDKTKLRSEFAAYADKGPAAFDNRLYAAAYAHSLDLISRDAQDHTGQFTRIESAGFHYTQGRGSVFSYSFSGINTHAAWNIDWGYEPDGMQTGRGHRMATMSVDGDYTNVGIAAIHETNSGTSVGEYVTTGNYCQANTVYSNHYNIFIVGTIWTDANGNDQYDPGEGMGNVTVIPDQGGYYAVTGSAGGYAIPVSNGTYSVSFNGGGLTSSYTKTVTVSGKSAPLDINTSPANQYSLTVSQSGTGSGTVTSTPAGIDCGTDCSENYDDGTIVSLTASPSSGSTFTGWAGDCSGTGTCQVTTDAAKSVIVTFDATPSYSFPWNLFLPSIINSTQ